MTSKSTKHFKGSRKSMERESIKSRSINASSSYRNLSKTLN